MVGELERSFSLNVGNFMYFSFVSLHSSGTLDGPGDKDKGSGPSKRVRSVALGVIGLCQQTWQKRRFSSGIVTQIVTNRVTQGCKSCDINGCALTYRDNLQT